MRAIFGNSAWVLSDRSLRLCVSLVVGLWIARYLGPALFGKYNLAIAFVALFSALATLGLDQIVVRDLIASPEHRSVILGSALRLRLFGSIALILAPAAVIRLTRPGDHEMLTLVLIIASASVFQSWDVIDLLFQSEMRSKYTALARYPALIIANVVRVYLVVMRAPLLAFATTIPLEAALGAAGLAVANRRSAGSWPLWRGSIKRASLLLRDSWPLALSAMVIMIYMRIDQVMLGQMLGDRAVGIYSAAVRLSEVWYFVPTAFVISATPAILEAKARSEVEYAQMLARVFQGVTLIGFAAAAVISFSAGYIVRTLYGAAFAEASSVLVLHIWAGVFVCLGVALAPWTTAERLMRFALLASCAGAIVNVALNIILIPLLGIRGPAVATLIAQATAAYLINLAIPKGRNIFANQTKALFLIPLFRHVWRVLRAIPREQVG